MAVSIRPFHCIPVAFVAGLLLTAPPASASGGRQGVHAVGGEMVILRDVSARPAYRPAPPGMALIVDPSPVNEINMMLGLGEMSDAEYAEIGAGSGPDLGPGGHAPTTMVERVAGGAINGSLGRVTDRGGILSGTGMTGAMSAPMGAMGNTTRGIGDHVKGALSQFPLFTQPATSGAPGG
ncbi:hypothetical protein [Novilysobacter spongiicola]|uniref:Uncharacterized protein n=1 Tax=Lysobacter spongiicola DSM 21749 TaxID=1122188 RepID=A0A1T4Q196_9GAMM|nr:hypothetical protein [Lysobacter spongiicola]SJZ97484.1 hypothetical protein SAMN02745674_01435 [Lysobacter spongiicola DSM 21749]